MDRDREIDRTGTVGDKEEEEDKRRGREEEAEQKKNQEERKLSLSPLHRHLYQEQQPQFDPSVEVN